MTHEADNDNSAMSLLEEQYSCSDFSYSSAAHRVAGRPDQFSTTAGKSEREVRMAQGQWSNQDKQEWSCESCTYLNQPLFLSCEMCGQPRGEHAARAQDFAAASIERASTGSGSCQEVETKARDLKQERIQEIMALQHGIFNRIKEEIEEPDIEELENSFAWMELEEEDNVAELPAAAAPRVSCGSTKAGKKPSPMDASNNTVSTAAMSSLSGSSRFSLDMSAGSQHSRLNRNSAIPDQGLESLKGESNFNRPSYSGPTRRSRGIPHQTSMDLVDYNTLKASIEGASIRTFNFDGSVRSIPVALQEDANNASISSYGFGQDSNASLALLDDEPISSRNSSTHHELSSRNSSAPASRNSSAPTSRNSSARGLAETLNSFDRQPQQHHAQHHNHHEAEEHRLRGQTRVTRHSTPINRQAQEACDHVKELQSMEDPAPLVASPPKRYAGRLSPLPLTRRADSNSPPTRARGSPPLLMREASAPRMMEHHHSPRGGRRSTLLEEEPPPRMDPVARRSLGDLPLTGDEPHTRAHHTNRPYRSHGDLSPRDDSLSGDDSPGSRRSLDGNNKTPFAGLNATPKVHVEDNQDLGLGDSLHRPMPKAPVIPAEVKNSMASPRDSVFSRNLYAEKKQEAAAKNKRASNAKAVGIPILNRMLQRKKGNK